MKTNALDRYAYTIDSLESGATRTVHSALVSQAGVAIRVDWAGAASLATCAVLVEESIWEACANLDNEGPCDLLVSSSGFDHARLSRGPEWSMYAFEARLVPIEWKEGHEPGGDIAQGTVVELGVDYEYPPGVTPDSVPWQTSELSDGVHGLTLQHEQAASYELWVRLQDPYTPHQWVELRPIVRPGDGDPTPTPK